MLMMVDYVQGMTVKKSCKYGRYGSFDHVVFLVFFFLCLVLCLTAKIVQGCKERERDIYIERVCLSKFLLSVCFWSFLLLLFCLIIFI